LRGAGRAWRRETRHEQRPSPPAPHSPPWRRASTAAASPAAPRAARRRQPPARRGRGETRQLRAETSRTRSRGPPAGRANTPQRHAAAARRARAHLRVASSSGAKQRGHALRLRSRGQSCFFKAGRRGQFQTGRRRRRPLGTPLAVARRQAANGLVGVDGRCLSQGEVARHRGRHQTTTLLDARAHIAGGERTTGLAEGARRA